MLIGTRRSDGAMAKALLASISISVYFNLGTATCLFGQINERGNAPTENLPELIISLEEFEKVREDNSATFQKFKDYPNRERLERAILASINDQRKMYGALLVLNKLRENEALPFSAHLGGDDHGQRDPPYGYTFEILGRDKHLQEVVCSADEFAPIARQYWLGVIYKERINENEATKLLFIMNVQDYRNKLPFKGTEEARQNQDKVRPPKD